MPRGTYINRAAVVREICPRAIIIECRHPNNAIVAARVVARFRIVVARRKHDYAAFVVVVVDGVDDGLLAHVGRGVAPRVRRDLSSVVRAVDQGFCEATSVGRAEAYRGHKSGARAGSTVAARDARDSDAVVAVRGYRPSTVRAMRAVSQEVGSRAVGVVVPVAVVDIAVIIVVLAVAADFARILPDIVLEVLVVQVEASVEDLDDDIRVTLR